MTEQDILNLIKSDPWMMGVLKTAENLNLKDWAIGAGFVRNKVWDYLHSYSNEKVDTPDVDLVYFDTDGSNQQEDEMLSKKLEAETGVKWEVVNEVYAHLWNNIPPYTSTEDAISQWPETATAIGVKMEGGELRLIAPCGIEDLVSLIVRPCPRFPGGLEQVTARAPRWKNTAK